MIDAVSDFWSYRENALAQGADTLLEEHTRIAAMRRGEAMAAEHKRLDAMGAFLAQRRACQSNVPT